MSKEIKGKHYLKSFMRRIKQQWGAYSIDDIDNIQGSYEACEQKLRHQFRHRIEQSRALKNC